MAVKITSKIRHTLGLEGTLRDLFAKPSIAEFAGAMSSPPSASGKLIHFRAPTDSPRLLLFAPSILGSGLHFHHLARAISPLYDVATWRLPGILPSESPLADLSEITADIVATLRLHKQYKTISIVGWSFGGILSRHIAARLGSRCASVTLIDTFPTGRSVRQQDEATLSDTFNKIVGRIPNVGVVEEQRAALREIFRCNYRAMHNARRVRPQAPELRIFASESLLDNSLSLGRPTSPVVTLDGDHFSIIDPANTPVLAAIINQWLISAARLHNTKSGPPPGPLAWL